MMPKQDGDPLKKPREEASDAIKPSSKFALISTLQKCKKVISFCLHCSLGHFIMAAERTNATPHTVFMSFDKPCDILLTEVTDTKVSSQAFICEGVCQCGWNSDCVWGGLYLKEKEATVSPLGPGLP